MAAGQRKKRLGAFSIVSCNTQELYKAKKQKNIESSQNVLNMRPHISLMWDDTQNRTIAKREQIGITVRDMAAVLGSVPQSFTDLADVFLVPEEIFGLENLTGVLSYGVWETHLSELERKLLMQFLPRGTDVDQVLQALFMGENLHFGNPFIQWGSSVCSGNLHPDAVLQSVRCFKANKKAYYSELQKYHNDIVECLKLWRNRWINCKDPKKDIVEKLWRKGYVKHQNGSSLVASERDKAVSNSRKEDIPYKIYVHSGDVAKYMSYFKISKKQHQLVKRLKQNCDGIQSKSLSRVLGDIKSFHVQPYELFEEEQRKKLHAYWLGFVIRDLPTAFARYKERHLKRQKWWKCIEEELAETRPLISEDERDIQDSLLEEQEVSGETEKSPITDNRNSEDDQCISPTSHSSQPPFLAKIRSPNSRHDLPMVLNSEVNQFVLKQENVSILQEHLKKMNPPEDDIELDASVGCDKNAWTSVSLSDSYYHSPLASHGYMSAGELSISQPQPRNEQTSRVIDLETNMINYEDGESLLPVARDEVGGTALNIDIGGSLFSYQSEDPNKLCSFKGREILQSSLHDQVNDLKQSGLLFLPTNESPSVSGHFQPQRLFEQGKLREKEMLMHQMIKKTMHSSGQYPCREPFPSADLQNWAADSIGVSSVQSPVNAAFLGGHNLFCRELQVSDGWSRLEVPAPTGHYLGGRNGSNTDASIYNVLPQYNQFPSRPPHGSMSSEHFIPPRNFTARGMTGNADISPYTPHELNDIGMHEVATMKVNNTSWMNLQHPSSNPNTLGRTFLRSWNQ